MTILSETKKIKKTKGGKIKREKEEINVKQRKKEKGKTEPKMDNVVRYISALSNL